MAKKHAINPFTGEKVTFAGKKGTGKGKKTGKKSRSVAGLAAGLGYVGAAASLVKRLFGSRAIGAK